LDCRNWLLAATRLRSEVVSAGSTRYSRGGFLIGPDNRATRQDTVSSSSRGTGDAPQETVILMGLRTSTLAFGGARRGMNSCARLPDVRHQAKHQLTPKRTVPGTTAGCNSAEDLDRAPHLANEAGRFGQIRNRSWQAGPLSASSANAERVMPRSRIPLTASRWRSLSYSR
jgi:hypothetical protein